MSWQHDHYKATCRTCGHEGECIQSSDDWNRTETSYSGLTEIPPDSTAVDRKRAAPGDRRPQCPQCGGTDIEVGILHRTT
ncbi:hypothetical protein CFM90_26485 (plasmid) [Ralstonia solanacearum]|nr:hypothetical protein CFM90_26485 [Ralstonia solanacearum]